MTSIDATTSSELAMSANTGYKKYPRTKRAVPIVNVSDGLAEAADATGHER